MNDSRPKCETCRFWQAGASAVVGECHRHAPSPMLRGAAGPDSVSEALSDSMARWPSVSHDDWCGEHQSVTRKPSEPLEPPEPSRPRRRAEPAAPRREESTRSSPAISGLSTRSKKVMALLGISTWEQLSLLKTEDVRAQKGTSVGTINELRDGLQANGLAFADEHGS